MGNYVSKMVLKVGNIYKCGDMKVKLIHHEPDISSGGCASISGKYYLGVEVTSSGSIGWSSPVGVFAQGGNWIESRSINVGGLDQELKEIEKVKEMTVAEIEEAIGHKVKVIKG